MRVPVLGVPRAGGSVGRLSHRRVVTGRRYGAGMTPPRRWPTQPRRAVPLPARAGHPAPHAQRLGHRLGRALRLAGLRGAGHHERRLRRHPGPARRRDDARTRCSTHCGELAARGGRARSRPTSRTASPTTPRASPPPSPRPSALGLAGGSVEDFTGDPTTRSTSWPQAAERVRAAAEAAHGGPVPLRADRPGRELPARPGRPGRHHRPAAGLPGGGRRRAVRSTGGRPGRAAPAAGRGRPAGQRPRGAGRARPSASWPSSG